MAAEYLVFKSVSWRGDDFSKPRVLVIPRPNSYGVAEVKAIAKTILMEEAREVMRREEEQRRIGEEQRGSRTEERARRETAKVWGNGVGRVGRKGFNKPLKDVAWSSSTIDMAEELEDVEENFEDHLGNCIFPPELLVLLRNTRNLGRRQQQ